MPKHANIRRRKENSIQNDSVSVEEGNKWIGQLKNWAVRQLSSSASPQARNYMRQSIEKALCGYGPQSPKPEVDDIVLAFVHEVKRHLEKNEATQDNAVNSMKRKQWMDNLKDKAIAQLPATASAQAKTSLRQSIEEALISYGPGGSEREIEDIVTMLVGETKFQMDAEEANQRRAAQKKALIELADNLLVLALKKFPPQLVGAPQSNQFYHLVEHLQSELRSVLQDRLVGDESVEDLGQIIKAFLGGWEKSLHTNQKGDWSISRRLLITGLAAAAGAGITLKFPFLKEKFKQGADFVRTQVPWDEVIQTVSEAYQKTQPEKPKGHG